MNALHPDTYLVMGNNLKCQNKFHFGNGVDSLFRVNSKEEDGIFWCKNCLKRYEPELFMNINEEGLTDILSIMHKSKLK